MLPLHPLTPAIRCVQSVLEDLPTDVVGHHSPDETGDFPRTRSLCQIRIFALPYHLVVLVTHPGGAPVRISDDCGRVAGLPSLKSLGFCEYRGPCHGVGTLGEQSPEIAVARLRYARHPGPPPAGLLAGAEAKEGRELLCGGESGEVPDLTDEGHGYMGVDPSKAPKAADLLLIPVILGVFLDLQVEALDRLLQPIDLRMIFIVGQLVDRGFTLTLCNILNGGIFSIPCINDEITFLPIVKFSLI